MGKPDALLQTSTVRNKARSSAPFQWRKSQQMTDGHKRSPINEDASVHRKRTAAPRVVVNGAHHQPRRLFVTQRMALTGLATSTCHLCRIMRPVAYIHLYGGSHTVTSDKKTSRFASRILGKLKCDNNETYRLQYRFANRMTTNEKF